MSVISQRLAAIEDSLKRLTSVSALSPSQQTDHSSSSNIDASASSVIPTFDGETSFEVQTMQAGEAASNTVAAVFGEASSAQLRTAISSLITSLEAHNLDSRAHEVYLSSLDSVVAPEALPLPPAALISNLVKKFRSMSPRPTLANPLTKYRSPTASPCQHSLQRT